MQDQQKTAEQLLQELTHLRQQVAALQALEADRKQADSQLDTVHRKLRAVFDAIQGGLCAIDTNFGLTDINAAMMEAFGVPDKKSALGRKCFEVLKGRQSPCPYCAVLEAFRTKALVCRPSNPDDALAKDRSMEVFACPILNDDGKPIGAVEFAWDVTEQKRAQEAVQQEQRQLKRLLDMHERDRKLVAYEVHDGFVQPLTAAKMVFEGHLRALQDQHPNAAWEDCHKALQMLDRSIAEARRLIDGQRPMILDEMGLVPALTYLVDEIQRTGAPVAEFTHSVRFDRLASPLETAVFRIVQESLANVQRHSNSPKVRVAMVQQEDRIRLEVEDWGIGFDTQRVAANCFGLEGLRQRARLLGGSATIDSTPGKGTRITVDLPLVQDTSTENP